MQLPEYSGLIISKRVSFIGHIPRLRRDVIKNGYTQQTRPWVRRVLQSLREACWEKQQQSRLKTTRCRLNSRERSLDPRYSLAELFTGPRDPDAHRVHSCSLKSLAYLLELSRQPLSKEAGRHLP
ncbi:hypothetical protein B0I35DRAFT_12891 [Stachybotrys elegans]|uniref:Uncharacterized protein n=1 Tax=Stachybotrys elegans TaxID=80388 RepID=A0A8K0WXV8_9HYPO|nr:hypothetical protein B0I35DRAFT_12891 [Stachybotrys elegans]